MWVHTWATFGWLFMDGQREKPCWKNSATTLCIISLWGYTKRGRELFCQKATWLFDKEKWSLWMQSFLRNYYMEETWINRKGTTWTFHGFRAHLQFLKELPKIGSTFFTDRTAPPLAQAFIKFLVYLYKSISSLFN